MKRVLLATCLALGCAGGLSAQAQQAQDDQKKGTEAAKPAAERTATITGCLRAGDAPNSFVLANVKTDATSADAAAAPSSAPAAPPATPATPPANPPVNPGNPPVTPTAANPPASPDAAVGTSGAAPEPAADSIRLIGAPTGIDLKAHVGHTVKVTGMMTPASDKAKAAGKSINVKTVEHVSDTCK